MASFKKSLFQSLIVFLILMTAFGAFLFTKWGRPLGKTMLLVGEVVPNFPVKPLKYFSKDPKVGEIKLKTSFGEVDADLYRPNDNKKHPVVIFTLGTIVTRRDPAVTKFTQALARSGFVVLIPDIPDFLTGFVWTDSVETMKSSVAYLETQPFVDNKKIGFAGFCVGASAAIVAAEDDQIADKVAFISAISPYYDLISLSEAVITKQAEKENGGFEPWEPANLSVESVQKGFINYVKDEEERKLLNKFFLENEVLPEGATENFSEEARAVYDFLSNSQRSNLAEIWQNFPQEGKDLLKELSPSTDIGNLKAELFILNDKKDTFVSRIEGEKLAKSLPVNQVYFAEVDSFEHVNPKTRLERWAAFKQLIYLGRYLYSLFSYLERIN